MALYVCIAIGGVFLLLGLIGICAAIVGGRADVALLEARRREVISRYPVVHFTPEEYDALPCAADLPPDFKDTCPLGFQFAFANPDEARDMRIIGEIVAGEDLLANQKSTDLPKRGCNKYRVVIVPQEMGTRVRMK
jgi:hypothetical protein